MKILTINKTISLNFEVLDKFEVGIRLLGWEVKSIKNQQVSIKSAYVKLDSTGVYLVKCTVKPYKFASNIKNEDTVRDRHLLLNKKEIRKLREAIKTPGLAVVPAKIYENNRRLIKVEIAIVKGRKKFDKRQKLKEKDQKRRINQDRINYNF